MQVKGDANASIASRIRSIELDMRQLIEMKCVPGGRASPGKRSNLRDS